MTILSSDDVCTPEKLGIQVAFLDSHPDIGAVFAEPRFIDENGNPFGDPPPPLYKSVQPDQQKPF